MGDDILKALAPYLLEAITTVVLALGSYVAAWFRAREQRLVVQQATDEVEAEGHLDPTLRGEYKRLRAITLVGERLGSLTMPSPQKLADMVEAAAPKSQFSIPPSPNDEA